MSTEKTTMGIEVNTHKKLKALAAMRGCTAGGTLNTLVDIALIDRGINPETMRAQSDRN